MPQCSLEIRSAMIRNYYHLSIKTKQSYNRHVTMSFDNDKQNKHLSEPFSATHAARVNIAEDKLRNYTALQQKASKIHRGKLGRQLTPTLTYGIPCH